MDSIHDLGGRQGFGPIVTDEPDEPFHAAWEARLLGIVRAMSRPSGWTIDRFPILDNLDTLILIDIAMYLEDRYAWIGFLESTHERFNHRPELREHNDLVPVFD